MRHVSFRILLSCCGALAACSGEAASSAGAPESPPAVATDKGVRWSAVRAADDTRSLEGMGRLLAPPNARAEVTLPALAQIHALHVEAGQRVAAGQVLAEVVVADAARAAGQLEGARLREEAYAGRLTQLEQLRAEGLARGADLAEARARLAEARALAHEAAALLAAIQSAGLRRRGQRYEVLAPIAGLVVAVNAPVAAARGPSDGPVCVISGGSVSRVEARFGFALPDDVQYELWSSDARVGGLRLVSQAPEVNASDATRLAWFDLIEPVQLPQGSTVRVRLHVPEDSWVVPQTALSLSTPHSVRTARGELVPVVVLARFGGEVWVRGALRADDLVAQKDEAQP